jgi:hypothetical protein
VAIYHFSRQEIKPLDATTFDAMKIMERADLQRLLRDRLEVVVPDAMLLSEEFGDWEEGRRRIDLLALDRDARLVVIELKRTDDAGHVELQALRYAAMVSTMSFEQAVDAHAAYLRRAGRNEDSRRQILEFLGWDESTAGEFAADVRIVLVAGDFQREITTTVLWLNEHDLDIRCVRLRPYVFNGEILVDVQQVIPLPEAADYQIRVRERNEQRRVTAALAGERDRTKFDVTVKGQAFGALNKRRAILVVVRGFAAAGVSPEEMMRTVQRGDRFFVAADGDLDAAAFDTAVSTERASQGKTFDPIRWFCSDDELIHFGGRTYAVSNQWGMGTEEAIRALVIKFPDAGVTAEPSLT